MRLSYIVGHLVFVRNYCRVLAHFLQFDWTTVYIGLFLWMVSIVPSWLVRGGGTHLPSPSPRAVVFLVIIPEKWFCVNRGNSTGPKHNLYNIKPIYSFTGGKLVKLSNPKLSQIFPRPP